MAEETGLKIHFDGNPKDRFSRDVAQLISVHTVYLSSLNNIRNWIGEHPGYLSSLNNIRNWIGEHTEYLIIGYLSTLDRRVYQPWKAGTHEQIDKLDSLVLIKLKKTPLLNLRRRFCCC